MTSVTLMSNYYDLDDDSDGYGPDGQDESYLSFMSVRNHPDAEPDFDEEGQILNVLDELFFSRDNS